MKKKKECLYVRQRDRKELDMKSREREKKKKQDTRLYKARVL